MSAQDRLSQLANLLYGLTMVTFCGVFVELLAAKHFQEPLQLVPLGLCVMGGAVVLLAWKRPSSTIVTGLRVVMALCAAASLLGVWKHIEGNLEFVREMHPDTTGLPLVIGAVTGRAPLLASGALAIASALALLTTFAAGWSSRSAAPE